MRPADMTLVQAAQHFVRLRQRREALERMRTLTPPSTRARIDVELQMLQQEAATVRERIQELTE